MLTTDVRTVVHYRETLQSGTDPLYDITVDIGNLRGPAGNGFVVVGTVRAALARAFGSEVAAEFTTEAMSSDYAHLLETVAKYVTAVGDNVMAVLQGLES